ncbi:GAF domain-containing protein [Oscillochloris sp. ZM17-4]|uniref:GAF domain-containing protein n=1 Tax=Oscillochloris sp. ZM17-4 TaxID=2866714 RepID=UPI00210252AB|nr:GAF domain-containing protein [Oscillochloris sp. ZM17-4]
MPTPLNSMSLGSPNSQSRRLREALASFGAFFAAGRREGDPLPTLRDLSADWLRAEHLEIVVPAGTGALQSDDPGRLCGPVLIGRRAIGRIEAYRSRPFDDEDRALIGALGQIVGAVLEHSAQQSRLDQLDHQAQANADTLDRLLGFGRLVVSAAADPQHLALALVTQVPEMVTGERASLLLIPDHSADSPVLALSNGTFASVERAREVRDSGLAGLVFSSRAPMIIDETDTDRRWLALQARENDAPTRCAMAVPLIWGERLLGALTVTTTQTHLFGTPQLDLLELVSCHISLAIHAASADAYLARMSDTLSSAICDMEAALAAARSGDVAALDRMQALLRQLAVDERAMREMAGLAV